jgi:hypothetical protein
MNKNYLSWLRHELSLHKIQKYPKAFYTFSDFLKVLRKYYNNNE